MFSATRTYWAIVALLLTVSTYFASKVELYRSGLKKGSGTLCLESGQSVEVQRVIDGDELLVQRQDCVAVVRMLGIKSFDPMTSEPSLQRFASQTIARLKRLEQERVTLTTEKLKLDARKRILSRISSETKDVGLELIREGLVLVYRKYPFAGMDAYLAAEGRAQAERRGLWADPAARARALALQAAWRRERKR